MLNIALFGPPGAGKGTQAKMIVDKYNLKHLSTGDMIRKEISEATELGLTAQEIINRGELLSDEIVIKMVENCVKSNMDAPGFLFDGFPRTQAQAEILDGILAGLGTQLDTLVSIEVPFDILKARMLKRAAVEGRADDTEEVIENRFKEYNAKTVHVAAYYNGLGKETKVDGNLSVEEVFASIASALDKLK